MLSGFECLDGNGVMELVGDTDRNRLHVRCQQFFDAVVYFSAVKSGKLFRFFAVRVIQGCELAVRMLKVLRSVTDFRDLSAADQSNFD